ncbi:MAG TPA: hypothetical protein VEK07_21215 [Polyangiaceae bacterium]|nr:hypothetical protein [Polyangiaceae bacterium]
MNPQAPPPDAPADAPPSNHRAGAGYRRATISLLLGLVGMLGTCCGLGVLLSGRVLSARAPAPTITPLVDLPVPASRTPVPFAPREEIAWVRSIALHRFGGPLRRQLADQVAAARGKGEVVLVETIATNCDACDQIDRAMRQASVQAALSKTRLVYVPMDEFHSELGWLRMDESTAPWFYLLDARGEPRDAIGADEWDDNEAANIGPVLHAFVQGELRKRRHDWHGGATL